jgi:hypothetical protein
MIGKDNEYFYIQSQLLFVFLRRRILESFMLRLFLVELLRFFIFWLCGSVIDQMPFVVFVFVRICGLVEDMLEVRDGSLRKVALVLEFTHSPIMHVGDDLLG